MKRHFYLAAAFFMLVTCGSCKKETIEIPFEDVFSKPYTGGQIKLQYQIPILLNGISSLKDTVVVFNSIGNDPSQKDDYNYSKPSISYVQLLRHNPDDFQNRAGIFFSGIDLNAITLPYKFIKEPYKSAQINYVIGIRPFYDNNGNLIIGSNGYAATTYFDNFELTILSRINNRLQGRFNGTITNQDGLKINVTKGLFDIQIVEK